MKKKLILFSTLSLFLTSCESYIEVTKDIFPQYKSFSINKKNKSSDQIYNQAREAYNLPLEYSIELNEIYYRTTFYPSGINSTCYSLFNTNFIYSSSYLTNSNFINVDDTIVLYDGLNLYTFDDNLIVTEMITLSSNYVEILSSAIYKVDSNYCLFSVESSNNEMSGRLITLNKELKILENKILTVTGHPKKEDMIYISYYQNNTIGYNTDLSIFTMNNMSFKYDSNLNSLTTDGYTLLEPPVSTFQAIKKVDNSYKFDNNHKFNQENKILEFPTTGYNESSLRIYEKSGLKHLFFQIKEPKTDECFLEYIKLSNSNFDNISHHYFKNNAYFLRVSIDEDKENYFCEIVVYIADVSFEATYFANDSLGCKAITIFTTEGD